MIGKYIVILIWVVVGISLIIYAIRLIFWFITDKITVVFANVIKIEDGLEDDYRVTVTFTFEGKEIIGNCVDLLPYKLIKELPIGGRLKVYYVVTRGKIYYRYYSFFIMVPLITLSIGVPFLFVAIELWNTITEWNF